MNKLSPEHIIEIFQTTDQTEVNKRLSEGWKWLAAMSDGKGGVIIVIGKPAILTMGPTRVGAFR